MYLLIRGEYTGFALRGEDTYWPLLIRGEDTGLAPFVERILASLNSWRILASTPSWRGYWPLLIRGEDTDLAPFIEMILASPSKLFIGADGIPR